MDELVDIGKGRQAQFIRPDLERFSLPQRLSGRTRRRHIYKQNSLAGMPTTMCFYSHILANRILDILKCLVLSGAL